jgi:dihydrofolate reductase
MPTYIPANAFTSPVKIALVVAVARNGVIGMDGGLPWRLPSDLKTFRRLTMGKPVVMGRRTFQSLKRPLDGRDNLVVTRDPQFAAPGAEVFAAIEPAIARAMVLAGERGADEIMVIGGADIYAQLIGRADRLYWTEVDAMPAGDTLFPSFDRSQWRQTARELIARGPNDDCAAELVTLDRA